MTAPNFLEIALKYYDMGFSVIPIVAGKKDPSYVKWTTYQTTKASKEEIIEWWTKWPKANIAIVTGKLSNLFVADLDKYKKEYSEELALQFFPDSLLTATSLSPQKGEHLYFSFPENFKVGGRSDQKLAIDFRAEGNYIVAPPSVNGNGIAYRWLNSIFDTPLAPVPDAYILYINNNTIYGDVTKNNIVVTSCDINFNKGSRDQSLFHVAHTMIKGGAKKDDVLTVLNILAKQCNPPFPPNEIVTKCHSAIERGERKERNIAKEVADFVSVTSGDFSVTECDRFLGFVTTCDKSASRKAISRLKANNIIEKVGNKDGYYKKVETDFEFINFDENEPDEVPYPIILPLGLCDIAEVSQGNIILVAGEFNAGKTTFLLNILHDNKGRLPVRYITSEMRKSEFKKRFAPFLKPLSFWKQDKMTDYLYKTSDFHAAVKPEALNIIDYMEFRDADYTRGAEYLMQIHEKLTTGIAVVAIQKKEGTRMPRAGDMVVEKPRLAISFSKKESQSDNAEGICEILKCKMPKLGKIDGKKLRFEITHQGSTFKVLNDWGWWRF